MPYCLNSGRRCASTHSGKLTCPITLEHTMPSKLPSKSFMSLTVWTFWMRICPMTEPSGVFGLAAPNIVTDTSVSNIFAPRSTRSCDNAPRPNPRSESVQVFQTLSSPQLWHMQGEIKLFEFTRSSVILPNLVVNQISNNVGLCNDINSNASHPTQ